MPDPSSVQAWRPMVGHLSAGLPDPINSDKTSAIARLIVLAGDRYDDRVISLNRESTGVWHAAGLPTGSLPPLPEEGVTGLNGSFALNYLAPPRGFPHAAMLDKLADWIAEILVQRETIPNLVVDYKLAVEGPVVHALAMQIDSLYVLAIKGNTDRKILSARPKLAARLRTIFHEAACVFFFALWARRVIVLRLGTRRGTTVDLPYPTVNDTIHTPIVGGDTVVSVFHLRNHRIKILSGLAATTREIARVGRPCKMPICGGGTGEEIARCTKIVADILGTELMGSRTLDELEPIMREAAALVTPSRRESFGLVFVEALFAGLPIIYPKGADVDGCFEGLPCAAGVEVHSARQIYEATSRALAHIKELKAALSERRNARGLKLCTRAAIARTFAEGLDSALAQHKTQEASLV